MKGTIKVMNVKPDITDDEIRSFMNFDKVLAQQKAYSAKRSFRNGAVALAGIIVLGGLWFYSRITREESQSAESNRVEVEKLKNESGQLNHDSIVNDTAQQEDQQRFKRNNMAKGTETRINKSPALKDSSTAATNTQAAERVYVQAEPVDGYPALYEYFSKELSYPAGAVKDSVQGVVMVAFTISLSGKPENISVEQSLGPAFDSEAVRVIANMPLWKPATYNNKPMTSRLSVPLTFQIKKTKAH